MSAHLDDAAKEILPGRQSKSHPVGRLFFSPFLLDLAAYL